MVERNNTEVKKDDLEIIKGALKHLLAKKTKATGIGLSDNYIYNHLKREITQNNERA